MFYTLPKSQTLCTLLEIWNLHFHCSASDKVMVDYMHVYLICQLVKRNIGKFTTDKGEISHLVHGSLLKQTKYSDSKARGITLFDKLY